MGLLSKIKDDLIPNELKSGSAAKKAIRNLIPNELADVAVKAAPFVAMIPGQQGTAALMRGLGRFDQRGSMSDALKQGLGTLAFGTMASPLTSKIPGIEGSYEGLGGIKDFGIDAYEALKTGGTNLKDTVLEKVQQGDYRKKAEKKIKEELGLGDKDKKGGIWDIFSDPKKTIPMAMLGTWIKEKYFPDDIPEDPALKQYKDYMRRRGQDVSSYLNQYGPIDFRRDPEANPYTAEEIQQFVELNTPEYEDYNKGGRVSLALGGNGAPLPDDPTKPVNPWAPKPIKPLGVKSLDAGAQDITYEGDQRMAGGEYNRVLELLEKIRENIPLSDEEKMELQGLIKTLTAQGVDVEKLMSQGAQGIQMAAQGGRIGYSIGSPDMEPRPTDQMEEIEGETAYLTGEGTWGIDRAMRIWKVLPDDIQGGYGNDFQKFFESTDWHGIRMAKGGRARLYGGGETAQAAGIMGNLPVRENSVGVEELDLRETGGFIPPVGVKEKADDIPAMLSNNEFVWTADAVRAAGGGSVNKGAQILYDQMKQLEGQVT